MYSFEPSDEQKMLIDVVRRYASSDLRPAARDAEEQGQVPQALIAKGWELGTLQASIPAEFGGFGARSSLTGVLAAEELAFGDLAGALAVLAPGLFALPILAAGSDEQKRTHLPAVVDADWQPYSAALIEPKFDFDPMDLETTAVREGDDFYITGEKTYVPYADSAAALIVYARLDDRTQGFIVPKDAPGLTVGERQKLLGIHALPTFSVRLERIPVAVENLLGGPEGADITPVLDGCRLATSAMAVGLSRAAFEYARDYAKEREVFGTKIAQKQSIAFMLAEMATEIEATRLMTWEAAWMTDEGKADASKFAYLALTGAIDMAMMVTDRGVQILGGHGFVRDHPVELWMRNGRGIAALTGLAII